MSAAARHPLGASLVDEVDGVVAAARRRGPLRLDMTLVAARLDVEVVERDLGEHLLGLTLDDRRVLVHRDRRRLRGSQRLLVFAHELAHVLRRMGLFAQVSDRDEEWFADWFAREMVLPRAAARRRWSEVELAAWHVDFDTVALQLAALGEVPQLMRNGRRVLCGRCGTARHRWPCECSAWRQWSGELHDDLPDVRRFVLGGYPSALEIQLDLDGLGIPMGTRQHEVGRRTLCTA